MKTVVVLCRSGDWGPFLTLYKPRLDGVDSTGSGWIDSSRGGLSVRSGHSGRLGESTRIEPGQVRGWESTGVYTLDLLIITHGDSKPP